MKSLRFLDRRAGYSLGSLGLLLGMIVPAVFPAFASAANQVSSRSIALSSSAAAATPVTYSTTFTPVVGDGTSTYYTVLIFCNDSPIVGQTCTAPTGFTAASATLGTGSTSGSSATISSKGANYIIFSSKLTASTAVTLVADNVTNPTSATTSSTGFYGRIETFSASSDATAAATTPTTTTNMIDQGGVAMAITNAIGVTASVRETMTFCVFGALNSSQVDTAPTAGCTNASGTAASMTLGEGTPKALDPSAISTGKDYAQISTNAVNGAVVYLKNSNTCGGLKRSGASSCDIAPVNAGTLAAGSALFGVKLGSSVDATGGSTPSGTITSNSSYSNYNMLISGAATATDSSGTGLTQDVTSTYGGYLFGTNKAPISNKNIPLTFAASASNTTPAGTYSASISLIATGTF